MQKLFVVGVAVAILLAQAAETAARRWRDAAGTYSFAGDYVDSEGDTVRIRLRNGHIVSVPWSELNPGSQRYVALRESGCPGSQLFRWPRFSRRLPPGRNDVIFDNGTDSAVRVWFRVAGWGKDVHVPAQRNLTIPLPDGFYEVYSRFKTRPQPLFHFASVALAGTKTELRIGRNLDGGYKLHPVK